MTSWPTARIRGQESFLLKTRTVELALTVVGGHLGPVTFFPEDAVPIEPYAIAPWAEELLPTGTPPVIASLRGDWFCSAFGANSEPYGNRHLPLHGETANCQWRGVGRSEAEEGSWLRLGVELPLQGGTCEATTALLTGHSLIYQRHDFRGLSGPINPGHHATLQFPEVGGAGRLSFSRFKYARTYAESAPHSCLVPDAEIVNLKSVRCLDGSTTDLSRYPARRGFDDIVILCADSSLDFAWSTVTFPELGFVWFSLRNPTQLVSTLLWFSNGGFDHPPWNARHVNVMGIEDMTGFFHEGLGSSSRPNTLTERGIRTHLLPDAGGRLSIPYIQGVARVPANFERIKSIEQQPLRAGIVLRCESGVTVPVDCELEFLHTGQLSRLGIPIPR